MSKNQGIKLRFPSTPSFHILLILEDLRSLTFFVVFLRESACYSTISAKLQILPKIESLQCSQGTGHVDNWCRAEVPCDQS